jgi:glutathione S-transferase/RNA polymerase-associated protein
VIKLFEHPLSPYAQKVKLALIEKGIPFETAMPDLLSGGDAAFRAASPRLEVPALVDGDATVFDSTIILEYLEDKWPTPPMLPAAPRTGAGVRSKRSATPNTRRPIQDSSRSGCSGVPRGPSPRR